MSTFLQLFCYFAIIVVTCSFLFLMTCVEKKADTKAVTVKPSIHRVSLQCIHLCDVVLKSDIDCSLAIDSAISEYFADIDQHGALRPDDISFFYDYNDIIYIIYIWR